MTMNRSEALQALNLGFFITEFLTPEIAQARRARKIGTKAEVARSRAALFEVFGWLILGMQLRYFHEKYVDELVSKHYEDLFPTDPDPLWESELRGLFPELGYMISRTRRTGREKRLYLSFGYGFARPEELAIPFRSALLLASRFARDPVAQIFSITLDFETQTTWERLVTRSQVEPEEILLAVNTDHAFPPVLTAETVYAGFFRVLDYMDGWRQLFGNLNGMAQSEEDLLELERRARQLEGWRANLRDRKDRFIEIAKYVNEQLRRELEAGARKDLFLDHVNDLIDYWLGYPRAQVANVR